MWPYAAAIVGTAVVAESLGLGGIPSSAVVYENILFVVFILSLIAIMLRRSMRR